MMMLQRNKAFRKQQKDEDFLENTFTEYLGCHPTYTIPLIRAHNFIMRDVGPINPTIRIYIALMASARHRCSFLVHFLKKQFILNGGDAKWLNGLEHAPTKLQLLNNINKILAHQPWLFQATHIQSLTKNLNSWTLPELTHAIVIMAHFHSLCSLAFGCKFGFEPPDDFDSEDGDCEEVEIEELRFDGNGSSKIKKIVKRSPASRLIVERCRQLEQEDANLAKIMNSLTITGKRKTSKYYGKSKNDKCPDGKNDSNHSTASGTSSDSTNAANEEFKENTWSEDEWKKHNFDIFVDDLDFAYIDFAKRSSTISTYRIQDYQWDDQGYSLSNCLYPDIGSFLDEKFKVGYNLTYYTLGPKTNIDTSPFRRALWNYIQSIYGIRHDDYNYREVNILLERQLKCYIKHLGCYPQLTCKHDFRSVMKGFRASEKVHVIIMVAEARLQAEILYAMRALMNYIKLSA